MDLSLWWRHGGMTSDALHYLWFDGLRTGLLAGFLLGLLVAWLLFHITPSEPPHPS